jgi:TetR/AcrR family acrAB operon transcriptional repressor
VRDIIRAAGVTQPTLYYHFRDKAAIFQALIQQHYAESQSRLREIAQSIPDCTSRLRAMLVRSFAFCCNDPRIPRLMFQTHFGRRVPEIDGDLDKLTEERFGLVKQIMQRGIESHELRPSDPQLLALSFCCLIDQPINLFTRRAKPSRFLREELASALLDQFFHGAGAR